MLDKYHGLPNGMFSGDEHFAGPNPSQGIELCAVVEAMFSYEQAFAVFGDPRVADRLEKVSYNALPGTLSNDIWSHQYDQQPNQIACTRAHRQWSTNGPDSNLFGLEPNFGCCTANLTSGLAQARFESLDGHSGRRHRDDGLCAEPSSNQIRQCRCRSNEDTEYPFRGKAEFTIHTTDPVSFPFVIRVPVWADSATVKVNGDTTRIPPSGCVLGSNGTEPDRRAAIWRRPFIG